MIKGTTPTEIYHVGSKIDLDLCTQIWITIVDWNGEEFTWDINRLVIDNAEHTISLTLSQTETLRFATGRAYVQIRFLYDDETAFASKRIAFNIEDVKKGGVIS